MDSRTHHCDLPDIAATEALGGRLARLLRPGDVVTLSGPLGAGKSALARALIRARLGEPELDVPSPTFTLVQTYMAPDLLEIWHIDLYRMEHDREIEELGLEDAFRQSVSLIEWPERLGAFLPQDRLDISLTHNGDGRRAELNFRGERWRERFEGFR